MFPPYGASMIQQTHQLRVGVVSPEALLQLPTLFPVDQLRTLILDNVSMNPSGLLRDNLSPVERGELLQKYAMQLQSAMECFTRLSSVTIWHFIAPRRAPYRRPFINRPIPAIVPPRPTDPFFDYHILLAFLPSSLTDLTLRVEWQSMLTSPYWSRLTQLKRLMIFGERLNVVEFHHHLPQKFFSSSLPLLEDFGMAFAPGTYSEGKDHGNGVKNLEFCFRGIDTAHSPRIRRLHLWMSRLDSMPTLEQLHPLFPHLEELYLDLTKNLPRGQFFDVTKRNKVPLDEEEQQDERIGIKRKDAEVLPRLRKCVRVDDRGNPKEFLFS